MSKMKLYIAFFTAFILLTGCEEEYILDTSNFESRIVVNAIFEADMPWEIHLSNTHNIVDPNTQSTPITDAVVKLYGDRGNFICELHHTSDGYYRNEHVTPKQGNYYTLEVTHADYPAVRARGYCPADPKVEIGGFERRTENGHDGIHLDFEIFQEESRDNFYIWQIRKRGDLTINEFGENLLDISKYQSQEYIYEDLLNADYDNNAVSISIKRKFYNFSNNVGATYGRVIGTTVDGTLQESAIHSTDTRKNPFENTLGIGNGDGGGKPNVTDGYTYQMKMITLSEDVYDYLSHAVKMKNEEPAYTSSNGYVVFKSNVDGGLGIFAGVNSSLIQF